jgi:predicted dehydrogenase/threonine dehydrogenase-like Zn-dependent dehydrogenase
MKQVAQNYRSGELTVLDVPAPACAPGGVLVRSLYSLISTGTELMKVSESKMSLIGKARSRPDQMKKVLETVQQQGPMSAYRKAMNKLDSYTPLGYSLAGVVTEVGRGAEEFHVGQVVACAGNEFALHAELNWVPINLCVPVPDGVAPHLAAFATVGSIAMQGVRQGNVALGDTALVIGLGLVGQLVVQLLVASGVKVLGIDMVAERCQMAEKAGAILCAAPDAEGLAAIEVALAKATGGVGADEIFLVASGHSNEPVEVAARMARDRATVVDIGKCKLDLPWNAYYEKELDVRFSRSYGPGRYDPTYEVEGVDYPVGYVRWTERRNLACFVDLIASGDIDPEPLVSGTFPVEDAVQTYERLNSGDLRGVGFLFKYDETSDLQGAASEPSEGTGSGGPARSSAPAGTSTATPAVRRGPLPAGSAVRVGFIGAGNYASSMLLPHLANKPGIELARVATRRSLSAVNAKRKFSFADAGTDTAAVLEDPSIDVVFVVTRHSSHASLACQALEAGKAVFVEKPLALSTEELDRILATVERTGNDRLMVGFNRRFSPMLALMHKRFGPVGEPVMARYLVNAGPMGADSWYRAEGEGSRFVGEGGHFIDTMSWWIGADPIEVSAQAIGGRDNVQVSLRYSDGSLGTITYFANGHTRFPKETFEAAGGGKVARLDNFKKAGVWSGRVPWKTRTLGAQDKGQAAEMAAFFEAVRSGGPMPISLSSLAATTRATLAVEASVASRAPEKV